MSYRNRPQRNSVFFGRRKSDGKFIEMQNGSFKTMFASPQSLKACITQAWIAKTAKELYNKDPSLYHNSFRRCGGSVRPRRQQDKEKVYSEYDIIELNIEEYLAEKVKELDKGKT